MEKDHPLLAAIRLKIQASKLNADPIIHRNIQKIIRERTLQAFEDFESVEDLSEVLPTSKETTKISYLKLIVNDTEL